MKMKRLFLWMLTLPLIFISCQNDEISEADDLNNLEKTTELSAEELAGIRMCKDVYPEGVTPRAAAISDKVWPNGITLTVKLDRNASQYVRDKVMQYANEWSEHANITFKFVTRGKADIRVTFKSGGSYSYIGTDALLIKGGETMNFGWFDDNTSDGEFSRTTIHEFGHALGLIHEHQHPEVDIPWDKPKVYEYYGGAPNYWSEDQVDHNLFATYSTSETQFSEYDPLSIMHYSVDNALTIGDFEVGWNTQLSDTDKTFIAELYPY
ncbi:M12 family metallopeptidase [Sinomicrobium weinanense]|nr:M12 family metallopeptidase [Sinomicrobium weinanense]MBU3125734.1 peptidase M12 [Sinomicrobium weinanense]